MTEKLPQGYCAHRPKTSEALISRKTLEPTMSSDTVGNTYYLLGALEDGYIGCRKDKGEYLVEFYQKNREWLWSQVVTRLRENGFNPRIKQYKQNYWRVTVYSKNLFEELDHARKTLYKLLANTSLEDSKTLNYLRGAFDCEGAVHKTLFRITLWNKDIVKLELIKKLLETGGIKCGAVAYSRSVGGLPIYGKRNLQLFNSLIGFRHPLKKASLERKGVLAQP